MGEYLLSGSFISLPSHSVAPVAPHPPPPFSLSQSPDAKGFSQQMVYVEIRGLLLLPE